MAVKENPDIDRSFRKGTRRKVKTVAAIIAELQQLPPRLSLVEPVRIVVTNLNDRRLALDIRED
jgi:hypothetical protein